MAATGLPGAVLSRARGISTAGEQSILLYLPNARRRIAEELPDAKLIAIIRDPIDRAYSNWMHLWVDGLEPESDFATAWHREQGRIDAGWAPFWHDRRMGRYGEQLADLFSRVDRDRVLVMRYRQLVSEPVQTLNRVAAFLGIADDQIQLIPADKLATVRRARAPRGGPGPLLRAGAWAGSYAPPQLWRRPADRC